jgi:uncharacterized alkaline shock family protein YloU
VREPLAAPAQRGHLHVVPLVVDRVAGRAATSVAGVVPGTVGRLTRRRLPHVDTRTTTRPDGEHAHVRVEVAVAWGHPLEVVAATVQAAVADRVQHLTGMHVDRVDVAVDDVVVPDAVLDRRVL